MNKIVYLDEITDTWGHHLLSWPQHDEKVVDRRLRELKDLDVEAIYLNGPMRRGELRFLGKGHVGLVVQVRYHSEVCALKIRRTDADRSSLLEEARNQALANDVEIGPKLYEASDDFLVMELIKGEYLPEWLGGEDRFSSTVLCKVLRRLLDKAYRLDSIGLDHGELGKPRKHVIVSDKEPRIIDFESASINRRPSNITSLGQFLFLNPRIRAKIEEYIPLPDRERLIMVFRRYKNNLSKESYQKIINVLGII